MAEPLRRVGRYEILEVIGRGGTAIVYLAHQPDLNRHVALKELSAHHAGDPRFAERFIDESRLIGAMNHPNIVTVHEFFEDDGLPYIAMEYLPRGSLRPYLTSVTLPQIFGVAEDVLSGLGHGESHDIVHRDLKPENLLVTGDGHVKVTDYGVARALNSIESRSYATMTGTAIGTPAYMAPEQALGEVLGPESDLYSLGIILWEALARRLPFAGKDTPMAVLYQKTHEPVPAITSVVPDVDPRLARWLETILAREPADRFASAGAAWDELEDIAISVLGPRWRREARIDLEMSDSVALDSDVSAALDPRPRRREDATTARPTDVTPTGSSSAASVPAGSSPVREAALTDPNATLMRNSRRHGGEEAEVVETASVPRRWRLWLALALAAIVAAGAGVGVGLATTPGAPPTPPARTLTTPAVALATAVTPVLSTLATAEAKGIKHFASEKNSTGQASAASLLKRDYQAAEKRLNALPAAEKQLASAHALLSTVTAIARDWGEVASNAKAKKVTAYDAARTAVERDSARLPAAAAAADRG